MFGNLVKVFRPSAKEAVQTENVESINLLNQDTNEEF